MSTEQNPPAFPQTKKLMNDGFPDTVITEVSGGMTLRDYFAAKAMQGMCANEGIVFGDHKCPEHPGDCAGSISATAYQIADAMLAQRNQPTDKPNK